MGIVLLYFRCGGEEEEEEALRGWCWGGVLRRLRAYNKSRRKESWKTEEERKLRRRLQMKGKLRENPAGCASGPQR